ncbi:MAG: hypothetical protein A2Y77_14380 [Planctomycetes bacterium RBG_13_62_9]|nr:MAG: hypothetical protein A2Y77_14380 [Planctomycetes bacterium RBG_13_62_9]
MRGSRYTMYVEWQCRAQPGDGLTRGEGVPPLRVAGILSAIRGQDALDTKEQGQDGLATYSRRQVPQHLR